MVEGLSSKTAAEKLKVEGPNEIPSGKSRSFLKIVLETFREPMLILLLLCAVVYFPLGNIEDALILLVAALVIIIITIYQERKTEKTLDALRELASPQAIVIRDGVQMQIPGKDVVRDDIVVLQEGGRVPADALIVETQNLVADESLLTGESVPVNKTVWDGNQNVFNQLPGGNYKPQVFFGTMVVGGHALARVYATGIHTQLGKIGKSLNTIEREKTSLDGEVKRLVMIVGTYGFSACLVVLLLYGFIYGQWVKGLLSGLTLAMAMLPEEFPVVLTIFLSIGAWRIAKKKVLTRKISSIEALGAATVLCVDKTGTITVNKMQVAKLYIPGQEYEPGDAPLPESFHELVEFAILASQKNPFDPMEKAILYIGNHKLGGSEHLHTNWELVKEYPLSAQMMSMAEVWKGKNTDHHTIAAKGAPEAILDLCHMGEKPLQDMLKSANDLAAEGLRILGVAKASQVSPQFSASQHDFNFYFIGFIGLGDPIRPAVPAAIDKCRRAGIQVKMITGDYPATAKNIASRIRLANPDRVLTGEEIRTMNPDQLAHEVELCNVFSRVVPEQKLMIVNALKAKGEIVAMTGDGVNDAPALKSAHIGIAMGKKGTDVAREAASLVLLNDDFSSIVDAVGMGRRIYHNLQKAMSYIFAIHIPIAGLSLLPLFFKGLPVIFFPIHIVFMEMIIDPACTILFEAEREEENSMKKPPRSIKMHILGNGRLMIDLFQGLSVLVMVATVYFITYAMHYSEKDVRAITFCAMIIGNLSLILTNLSDGLIIKRKRKQNPVLIYVLGGAVVLILAILYIPPVREIFHFGTLHPDDLALSFLAGVAGIIWFEVFKYVRNQKQRRKKR